MGNSLQEQLLKAGLISEEQLREANRPARSPRSPKAGGKRRKRPRAPSEPPPAPEAPAAAAPPPLEALNARIRKLLDEHRENADDAELPYNFARENRIKKLYVTEDQRRRLLSGELAIAGYRRVHHVIPAAVAEEIQSLRPEIFVHRAGLPVQAEAAEGGGGDVPDDLVW